jgi:hypothetical protein
MAGGIRWRGGRGRCQRAGIDAMGEEQAGQSLPRLDAYAELARPVWERGIDHD